MISGMLSETPPWMLPAIFQGMLRWIASEFHQENLKVLQHYLLPVILTWIILEKILKIFPEFPVDVFFSLIISSIFPVVISRRFITAPTGIFPQRFTSEFRHFPRNSTIIPRRFFLFFCYKDSCKNVSTITHRNWTKNL